MVLNDFQQKLIEHDVQVSGVYMKNLGYDILDHLCCMVEFKMDEGLPFDKAYELSKQEFSPNGLGEVQEETTLLLNLNSKKMKTTKKIIGITGAILLLTGKIMGFWHLLGSGILTVLGFFFLTIFMLTQLKTNFLEEPTRQVKMLKNLVVFTAVIMLLGLCFYTMHWPGARILFILSLGLTVLGIAPLSFKHFNGLAKYLNGKVVGIGVLFLALTLFGFNTVGYSANFYESLWNTDQIVVSQINHLKSSNATLTQSKSSALSQELKESANFIDQFKNSVLNSTAYHENYPSDQKDLKYMVENEVWSNLYVHQSSEYSLEKLHQELQSINELLSQNQITSPIEIEDFDQWKRTYFQSKMLFGVFMYLDQIQLEVRKLEREVLLYHL